MAADLAHALRIPFCCSLAERCREESNDLNGFTQAHVITQYSSSLLDKALMQEFDALDLIIAQPLCDRCRYDAS